MGLLCVLVTAISSSQNAASSPTAPLEECEPALGRLITILESKRQLSSTRYVYSGGQLGSDYSKCRVSDRRRPSWPRHTVYRSNDNRTVVVEKLMRGRATPVLYGPFASAYRK
jgi:hypothetical protein